jgi:hypothetical protein
MRLAAVVARVGRIRSFFGPFENGQLRIATVDHDPAHRIIAFFATDFTFINCAYQSPASAPFHVSNSLTCQPLFRYQGIRVLIGSTLRKSDRPGNVFELIYLDPGVWIPGRSQGIRPWTAALWGQRASASIIS